MEYVASFILLLSMIYYLYNFIKNKETNEKYIVIGKASQITGIAFFLGFALMMIVIHLQQTPRKIMLQYFLYYVSFVGLVNLISIAYYEFKLRKK